MTRSSSWGRETSTAGSSRPWNAWSEGRSEESTTIEPRIQRRLVALLGERVAFGVPLARYTSLRVGGPADVLARPANRKALIGVLALAADADARVQVLGGGFNTLVLDGGIRGIVLQLDAFRRVEMRDDHLWAEAGATHATVTRLCAQWGRSGLEFAVGIPGTVGGWIAMNAGIPEREMKDVVERVEVAVPDRPEPLDLPGAELGFTYRRAELPRGGVILSGLFRTSAEAPARVRERMRAHMDRRRRTQPVDQPSCGSVFKNPPGDHAGRLIDAAGLKGAREGNAEISTLHANFIVNRGGASAADVLRLIERARREVRERFDVDLEPEVRVVGDEA